MIREPGKLIPNCYKTLDEDDKIFFRHKSLWNPKISQKVIFFVWTLCYNATPILDTCENSIMINGVYHIRINKKIFTLYIHKSSGELFFRRLYIELGFLGLCQENNLGME